MKPGLVLPKIVTLDPVQGDRIDAHLKTVAEFINGGLTAQSIAPSTRLSPVQFAENGSVFALTGFADSLAPGTYMLIGDMPSVSPMKLISVGWCISIAQSGTFAAARTLTIKASGATVFSVPLSGSVSTTPRGLTVLTGIVYPNTNAGGAAWPAKGLAATWTVLGAETVRGYVTVCGAVQHQ
jgi:hypothetical protein